VKVLNFFSQNIIEQIIQPSPNKKIELYVITYVSQGLSVKGLLAVPKGNGRKPAILYLRGGIKNVGMVRTARIVELASKGFIVLAPFYRGNKGGEGREDFAGDDLNDAITAFQLLKESDFVNHNHIHLFGFSRGGVMALLTEQHVQSACSVVTWGGVSDMVLTYEERVDLRKMMKRVIGGTPNKLPQEYEKRSAIQHIHKIYCPVLIIHGEKDSQVSVEHAYKLQKELERNSKHYDCWIYKQYGHHIPFEEKRVITKNMLNWMEAQQGEKTDGY
jgi:dipeptidyl aminopeptidase/acylaminoacyl peptidase